MVSLSQNCWIPKTIPHQYHCGVTITTTFQGQTMGFSWITENNSWYSLFLELAPSISLFFKEKNGNLCSNWPMGTGQEQSLNASRMGTSNSSLESDSCFPSKHIARVLPLLPRDCARQTAFLSRCGFQCALQSEIRHIPSCWHNASQLLVRKAPWSWAQKCLSFGDRSSRHYFLGSAHISSHVTGGKFKSCILTSLKQ